MFLMMQMNCTSMILLKLIRMGTSGLLKMASGYELNLQSVIPQKILFFKAPYFL